MIPETVTATYARLQAAADAAAAPLRQFPKGPLGLTPDAVKASPEWKEARAAYFRAADAVKAFYVRHRRELDAAHRAERNARRGPTP